MENARLLQLLTSLSPVELRAFDRFLQSPYFNLRTDVYQLFVAIRSRLDGKEPVPDRQAVFQAAFPGRLLPESDQRLLMTYLSKLFERFIRIEQIQLEPLLGDWLEVKSLYRLDLKAEGNKAIQAAFNRLENSPLRSLAYHDQRYRLLFERVRQNEEHPEENAGHLGELTHILHTTVAAMLLRQACLSFSQKAVYKMEPDTRFLPEIFLWVETTDPDSIPTVGAYYYACGMLMTGQESWFQQLKKTLLLHTDLFPAEELHDLHLLAINYCIRQLNAGNEGYFQEIHELYKTGLDTKTLLNNGVLSPLTYYNIVISGLKTNALDWVAWFIPKYKNHLDRQHRESSYSLNMARLHYARRDHGHALQLLQKANYRDQLMNLAAKTIALKIYYEQGEYDVLESHLEAMVHYIRRRRVIGYHRENYLNIIRISKRLLAIPLEKGPAVARLRTLIKATDPLTERGWFLEQIQPPETVKK